MTRLTAAQEKLLDCVEAMRNEVRDVDLQRLDCPLLYSQLSQLIVFAEALCRHARALRNSQGAVE